MASENPPLSSPLGTPNRYTTTHDPSTGKSVFVPPSTLPETLTAYGSIGMVVFDSYKTFTTPLEMTHEFDIAALRDRDARTTPSDPKQGVWFPAPGESVVRYCDWGPGATLQFHRTETIDFGVVVNGEMEMTLDSGEKRLLKVGDTIVQRGTLHAWRNPSDTVWARVVFFLLGTPPVRVGGEEKAELLPWRDE
ncbi:hypothetical protein B0H66DRAFT_487639 [Apodospora peruviana]|uniref:Cupin type-2 domain-containing protein n=1 Tax=Apodospora peruviana TaxID=516989 RepID=A0AAE0IUM3_9PEZI|nr:hypothetical protein B0H66DRAFT_487639 [Apodospora peruviana]